ncbi:MAG TPA: MBL fold metallo-hydrolase, partial [Solirubrobacterales bacterium]|nr:MBL fold metallo-hydrolase [Solirubrobacterales bacterium]
MDGEGAETAPGHPEILRLLAPNPGPMTGAGTNTYVYGSDPCLVIDPGVDDPGHLAAIEAAAAARGGIGAVVISHEHPDHTGGADRLGAPVLHPGEGERVGGLLALATPGHAADHICLVAEQDAAAAAGGSDAAATSTAGASGGSAAASEAAEEGVPVCFSGDLVLGAGSSFVPPDGGSLIAYLDSL